MKILGQMLKDNNISGNRPMIIQYNSVFHVTNRIVFFYLHYFYKQNVKMLRPLEVIKNKQGKNICIYIAGW